MVACTCESLLWCRIEEETSITTTKLMVGVREGREEEGVALSVIIAFRL